MLSLYTYRCESGEGIWIANIGSNIEKVAKKKNDYDDFHRWVGLPTNTIYRILGRSTYYINHSVAVLFCWCNKSCFGRSMLIAISAVIVEKMWIIAEGINVNNNNVTDINISQLNKVYPQHFYGFIDHCVSEYICVCSRSIACVCVSSIFGLHFLSASQNPYLLTIFVTISHHKIRLSFCSKLSVQGVYVCCVYFDSALTKRWKGKYFVLNLLVCASPH